MLKFFAKPIKNKKGFTLTELIVVVAILGVLAAVATPSIIGYINEAKVNADEANATTLENCYKRLLAKGTISATDTKGVIITAIETEINPIPTCQQADKVFALNPSTGDVKVVDKDAVEASNIVLNAKDDD